jgi:hypothetical protein
MRIAIAAAALLALCALPGHAQDVPAGVSPSQMFGCNQSALYDASTSGSTRLVVGNTTQRIYVCGWNLMSGGTVNVKLVYGTGGSCGTGTTAITPAFEFTAQSTNIDHLPVYTGITPVPSGNDLCINESSGVAFGGIVYFSQF